MTRDSARDRVSSFTSGLSDFINFIGDLFVVWTGPGQRCASSESPWEMPILTSARTGLDTTRKKLLPTQLRARPADIPARQHLTAVFERVTWAHRAWILIGGPKGKDHEFFKTNRACVLTLTLRNATEWLLLKKRLLIKSICWDIFPTKVKAILAQCNPPKLGSILRR
jgi:hypothetical protein